MGKITPSFDIFSYKRLPGLMNHFFTGLVSYGLIHQYPSLIHYPDTTPGTQIYGDVGDSGVNSGSRGRIASRGRTVPSDPSEPSPHIPGEV